MSKNKSRLVVITGDQLKEEFRIACDGRNMSHEIIKMMKEYIKNANKKKGE